jgi:hypothetical protein
MDTITPMQFNRFGHNRLDDVKQITPSEFLEGVSNGEFKQLKTFTTIDNLHYDEDNGGVFVWSNRCKQYFLIGKKVKNV